MVKCGARLNFGGQGLIHDERARLIEFFGGCNRSHLGELYLAGVVGADGLDFGAQQVADTDNMRPHAANYFPATGIPREPGNRLGVDLDDPARLGPVRGLRAALLDLPNFGVDNCEIVDAALL